MPFKRTKNRLSKRTRMILWIASMAVIGVGAVLVWIFASNRAAAGIISFQAVPAQPGAAITIASVELEPQTLWTPLVAFRTDSARSIKAMTPALWVVTPDGAEYIAGNQVLLESRDGKLLPARVPLP